MEPVNFDQEISVFSKAVPGKDIDRDLTPVEFVSIRAMLDRVKTGYYKNIVETARKKKSESTENDDKYGVFKKYHVPGFTLSAKCKNRKKEIPANEKLIEHTGILQIDIDHQEPGKIQTYFENLKTDPFILFAFQSLGGDGIKAGFRIPKTTDPQVHGNIAIKVSEYLKRKYDIVQDPKVKDLFRLFFIGYDPDIFINPNAKIYEIKNGYDKGDNPNPIRAIEPQPTGAKTNQPGNHDQTDKDKFFKQGIETVKKIINESVNGTRHHARLKAGYLAGGYIAGGICTESEVITEVENTILANTTLPIHQALKSFRDGIKAGQSSPIDLYRLKTDRDNYLKARFDNWHNQNKAFDYDPETGEILPTDPRIRIIDHETNTFGVYCFKFQLHQKKQPTIILTGIYQGGFFDLLQENGFYKRYINGNDYRFIRDQAGIIEIISPVQIRDFIIQYVKTLGGLEFSYLGTGAKYQNEYLLEQIYKQSQNIFSESYLSSLTPHTKPILTDTPTQIYFPFKNSLIMITRDGINQLTYDHLNLCIWKTQIINRDIELANPDNDKYFRVFLYNVSGENVQRFEGFCTAFGYLLHNYSNQSGRAVIAYDMELTTAKQPQGGTGKGIFAQAFRQLRKTAVIDGKKFDPSDRFCFQAVNETTQAVYIDDVKPNFDFLRLNSALTEGLTIEQKNQQSVKLPIEQNPKFYITANSVLQASGNTFDRRTYILEFAPYYKNIERANPGKNPIELVHGKRFFDDSWTNQDWNDFFAFAFNSCQLYLIRGLVFYQIESVSKNKALQTTSAEFYEFITQKDLKPGIEYDLKGLFSDFKQGYFENENFDQKVFTEYLKKFTTANGWTMTRRRSNNVTWIKFVPE